ncbi:MAG: TGS domain-containing protein, partial [Thiothrix sp.]
FDSQAQNSDEFYAIMQADIFQTEIYAYTPEGDVKELPRGATILDFAYAVHTEVGHHCKGAKIDGRVEYTLRSRIPNSMATIEIITDASVSPQVEWLNFVKTSRATANIRTWLRQHGMMLREELTGRQKQTVALNVNVRDVKGVLRQITKVLDSLDADIVDLKISGEGRIKTDSFTLQVDDQNHLQEVIHQLKRVQHVLSVNQVNRP